VNIKISDKRSQSGIEYVAAILVLIGALIWVGIYYQRSVQGKYRQTGEAISGGEQYTVH